jgi:hypothetical protein
MDPRLIPVNGLIALLRGDGGWPPLLKEQGFQRYQLESPLTTPLGDTRIDAVIFKVSPALVLPCECKSGENIDEEQARKYLAADPALLRRTDALPPQLRKATDVTVLPMFVGTEENRPELERGLRHLDIDAPLLTVGPSRIRLSGASGITGLDDFDHRHGNGLPPARLPVDHQSPSEEIQELLLPELIAAQARGEDIVPIEAVCAAVVPEWGILSPGMQGSFIRRTEDAMRRLLQGDLRTHFRLDPGGSNRRSRVVIETTPAVMDPRGQTQAWRAQQRRATRMLRGKAQVQPEAQLSLEDLAEQGGLADD